MPVNAPTSTSDTSEEWLGETEDIPRRKPRRRLLGVGGNPLAVALVGVLLCACGFIGGVLVQKGQEGSGSTGAGAGASALASRFAALRGGSSATGTHSSSGAASVFGAGGGRPTAGTVAYLAGSTLYVTNAEGNTVKVTTSAATSVKKTVGAKVSSIHPGETVTVTGETGSGGSISAESISVGSAGGGLAALFGGGAGGGAGASGAGGSGASGGGEPALFGKGG
jgi:hypothetical protein